MIEGVTETKIKLNESVTYFAHKSSVIETIK